MPAACSICFISTEQWLEGGWFGERILFLGSYGIYRDEKQVVVRGERSDLYGMELERKSSGEIYLKIYFIRRNLSFDRMLLV